MSIKKALYDFLIADNDVSNAVGDRIYPDVAPAGAGYPRITYQRISGQPEHHMTGPSGLIRQRFQIDCWGENGPSVETVSEAVRLALDTFRGDMGDVAVKSVSLESQADLYVSPTDGSQVSIRRTRMDFEIWHTQSV